MHDEQKIFTSPIGSTQPADIPQFSTAEYAHIPGTEPCKICGGPIPSEYFRVNNLMACATCAQEARDGQPKDSHVAFARALAFGIGGAVIGLVLYSTVAVVTGLAIGYVALAVGWLVAKAMMKGSNGMSGRRYQIAAVLLTYFAISTSAVPIAVSVAIKHQDRTARQAQINGQTNPGSATTPASPNGQSNSNAKPRPSFGKAMLMLALLAVASPFLALSQPFQGAIGLLILFFGLSIAFRMTAAKTLEVDGPYSVS